MNSSSPHSGPRSATRLAIGIASVLLPVVGIAVAWYLTRVPAASQPAAEHNHAMMGMPADSARNVQLLPADQRRIGITFAAVEVAPLTRETRITGQVTVDETRIQSVSSKLDGWVDHLMTAFTGQAIVRDAPLLSLQSPALVAAQEELLVAVKLANALGSGQTQPRSDAQALIDAARRRLTWWGMSDTEIDAVIQSGNVQRSLVLRAPISGFVLDKSIAVGQRVQAGDALYRVADLSTLWIEGEVYEQDLRAVSVGAAATAEFDALPGERFSGRIAYIYPTLTPETRTARIRVSVANPALRLRPGMFATLTVHSRGTAVLSVPRGAVLITGERQLVFVRTSSGQLEPRQVQLGATTHERIEILRGLAAGDTVVASATFLVDAESNLGTALGGMGDMPGMEVTRAPTTLPNAPRKGSAVRDSTPPRRS